MLRHINEFRAPASDISNLEILGSYSIDGNREYCDDLTQLKYYKESSNINNVDLNFDLDAEVTPRSNDDPKLDFMLKWVSKNFDILQMQNSENSTQWLQPDFICHRGILKALLLTPYEHYYGWILCASKFKGTIYLCTIETVAKQMCNSIQSNYEKRSSALGHRFEGYLLSDSPFTDPNISAPVNPNEQFCVVFKSKFGKNCLLYGAEIDGTCSPEIIENTVKGKQLELIEIKTVHERALRKGELWQKQKMLYWWAQAYPVGIQKIICGCKTNGCVIKDIIKVERKNFEHKIKSEQHNCKSFCIAFLEYLKTIVRMEYDDCLYKFTYDPVQKRINTEEIRGNSISEYTFLHSWYIEKAENFKNGKKT